MGQVQVTINGRSYRLDCADGQEHRLNELAGFVGEKVEQLVQNFGQVGDIRLFMMAALMTADELFDLREANAQLEEALTAPPAEREANKPDSALPLQTATLQGSRIVAVATKAAS